MQLWPVAHFFHFVITFGWVQQQSNSKPTQKWWQNEKKWATGQSCIRKEVTSYKIHTLIGYAFLNEKAKQRGLVISYLKQEEIITDQVYKLKAQFCD